MSWLSNLIFYLFVGLLLNWGLIPEQNTMSTCIEISEAVATELGRPELVEDYNGGAHTPNATLLRCMNSAHRRLDRSFQREREEQVYPTALAAGAWSLNEPDGLRYVTRIDLEDSDGNIVPYGGLAQRRLSWLRDYYGQDLGDVDVGEPKYWARGVREWSVPPERVVNGEFDEDYDGWEDDAGDIAWSAGAVEIATGAFYQTFDNFNPDGMTLRFSAVIPAGQSCRVTLSKEVYVPFDVTLTASGHYEYTISASADVNMLQFGEVSGLEGPVVLDDVSLAVPALPDALEGSLLLMPPADQDYTANIYGGFWADQMVDDTDVTWWSDKHPELLILAVKREIAMQLNRNSTEVKDYDADIEVALADLEFDEAYERLSGPSIRRRFGWRPT